MNGQPVAASRQSLAGLPSPHPKLAGALRIVNLGIVAGSCNVEALKTWRRNLNSVLGRNPGCFGIVSAGSKAWPFTTPVLGGTNEDTRRAIARLGGSRLIVRVANGRDDDHRRAEMTITGTAGMTITGTAGMTGAG